MPRKAGAYSPTQLAEWRERIKVGKAIETLNEAISGELELTTARMKAIEIALRKTLPDLQSVDLSTAGGEPIQFTWGKAPKTDP
jgi:hypothetical protein